MKIKLLFPLSAFRFPLLLCVLCASAANIFALNWTNYPTGFPGTNDTFLFATTATNQFGCPTNAQIRAPVLAVNLYSNLPPRVANPVISGAVYTTTNAPGFLTVNLVCTNSAYAWFTNQTSGFCQRVGAVNTIGTNYDSFVMRTAPFDVVLLTNQVSGVGIISSEWHP